ncbi:MAG TPA: 16S rRNA (cytosine(967)-C(5))-methyltransferase RsmB [Candidatus Acidoferrum sp.]|nr:16S rRNA (cytosine(967)-C(5))-methyltransferase RsmB [Candidatus Acidoferrum sp.]
MAISPARTVAFDVLHRVEAEGAYASDVLHAELGPRIAADNAALATEITFGVLRWRRLLDFLLDRELKKPVAKLDLPVALALRIGMYQLRFLERVPSRAAVHESVELVKRARKSSAASLVNAVLRKASAESARESSSAIVAAQIVERLLPPALPLAERLAILHSHPTWLVERWLKIFGEPKTAALLEANNRAPHLSCALHDPARREEIFAVLHRAGLRVEPGRLLNTAFVAGGGSPARTPAFREGLISVQDEASQAIPLLLGVQPGDRVLDLCAAPGGKTAPLIRAAGPRGNVVAADHHAHRLRAMRNQFERLALMGAQIVELDASRELPFGRQFDRILVDAPCSGTGTLARHPEIRWRLRPEQLSELRALQIAMLSSAIEQLAPKGRLVYSTCSLEPEENEQVIAAVMDSASSVRRVARAEAVRTIAPHLAPKVDADTLIDSESQFHTSPAENHTDGFFAAILEKP